MNQKEIGSILNEVSLFSWKQYVPITPEQRTKIIEWSAVQCEQEKKKIATKKPVPSPSKAAFSNPASPPVSRSVSRRVPFKTYGETISLAAEEMTYQRIADEAKVVLDSRTRERVGVCYVCKRPKSMNSFSVLPINNKQKNVGICKLCAEKSGKL